MHLRGMLRFDLEYCVWADRVALNACAAIPPAELARDLGGSHRCIITTLFHIFDSERFWFDCLLTHSLPPMDTIGNHVAQLLPAEETLAELQRSWPQHSSDFLRWLSDQSAEDLDATLATTLGSGKEILLTRWQILRHMINHSTLHRGQIINMVRTLGYQPPSTDLMTFYLSAGRDGVRTL